MFTYKNTSLSVKTFYGVQFKPGETHSVPGFINDLAMIRCKNKPKEVPKATAQAPKPSGQSNKSSQTPSKPQQSEIEESKSNKTEIKGGESEDGTDNN